MSHLLGMSFDSATSPSITLKAGPDERDASVGWGFGWYPADDAAAIVLKDPHATHETALTRVMRDWDRFRSSVFLCHTRGAAKRVSQQDTHPFARSYAGRDWLFAHNGDLDARALQEQLPFGNSPAFEPIGRTDSEYVFCWILNKIQEQGARSLADVGFDLLHEWLSAFNRLGTLNALLTDGHDVAAYHDANGFHALHRIRRLPPHERTVLESPYVEVDLGDPYDVNRTMVLFATKPLSDDEDWIQVQPGELLVARRGVFVYSSAGSPDVRPLSSTRETPSEPVGVLWTETTTGIGTPGPPSVDDDESSIENVPRSRMTAADATMRVLDRGHDVEERILSVEHETWYRYQEAVERSTHVFRLHPTHDSYQDVIDYQLEISPPGSARRSEDVFGNQALRFKIDRPYTALYIRSSFQVRVRQHGNLGPLKRSSIPLVWMPWQRQMMLPYLLPMELPESQLRALSEYAMSFVERQDFDLIETLVDINESIYRDFHYVPGSTNIETSPFQVFANRQGVCQDFANLFITMARLLGVPARYRVGYIHTGADYENQIQSEASHAWVECYLPRVGWRGFDPTNGCLAGLDHIRVAVGRNYRDATPTSGTLFKGGRGETLETSVRVSVL